MEYDLVFLYTALAVGILTIYSMLKRANMWFYTIKFSSKEYHFPPGDMGWPFFGDMLVFCKCFKGGDPDSFISYFVTRYGQGGMYKGLILGKPSIIVTKPEICMKILLDDENFDRHMPKTSLNVLGQEPPSNQDQRRMRSNPIQSHGGSLSFHLDIINETVKNSFEKWSSMEKPIEFLTEMKKTTFEILMRILIGDEVAQDLLDVVFKENTFLIRGFLSMPINIPGFDYNRANKARGAIVKIFYQILEERKSMIAKNKAMIKSSVMDTMLDSSQDDENIITTLVSVTFAGYEFTAEVAAKAIIYLEKHPEFLHKAKEEQEDIVKKRPSSNAGLNIEEIRQMKYLTKVINETLRCASVSSLLLRDAKTTVNINGYTIPKGWRFLVLSRSIHMDPDTYVKPEEFNPSRWDDVETKPAYFIPFGRGPKMCPGANLARLEVSVILHYFLLCYRLEQLNPESKIERLENCLVKLKKLPNII